jgi:HPt (histidine-containing phosphotransfer) domain-containing protein
MPPNDLYRPIGIDLRVLEDLFKGDRSRVHEWLRLYLEEAPKIFAQVKDAHGQGDGKALARAVHELRPQAHYLGAPHLLALLMDIGERCRTMGADACDAAVEELLALGEGVEAEVRAVLASAGN